MAWPRTKAKREKEKIICDNQKSLLLCRLSSESSLRPIPFDFRVLFNFRPNAERTAFSWILGLSR